jgi:hypothetical protein
VQSENQVRDGKQVGWRVVLSLDFLPVGREYLFVMNGRASSGLPVFGLAVVTAIFLSAPQGLAMIVYGRSNSENVTNPGIGPAWDAVVLIAKPSQESYNASAVYLGGGFFLTANHVDALVPGQKVKINGVGYELDKSYDTDGIKPIAGVDLKIFKVVDPPVLPSVSLNTDGSSDLQTFSYLVGGGVGKGTEVPNEGWLWGGVDGTPAKRWGINLTLDADDSAYLSGLVGYSALGTVFYSGYGADTGSVTLGDSGSALFQFIEGDWVLSGVPTAVEVNGSSFYNRGITNPPSPDYSIYVRISDYADEIHAAIPEPSPLPFLAIAIAVFVFLGTVKGASGKS